MPIRRRRKGEEEGERERGDRVGGGVEEGGAEPEPSQWLATGERG